MLKYKCSEVIPHLRPLSSLTESEARKIFEAANGYEPDDNNFVSCLDWWNRQNVLDYSNKEIEIGNPTVWIELLRLGIDIFGLIEAGLAKEIETK